MFPDPKLPGFLLPDAPCLQGRTPDIGASVEHVFINKCPGLLFFALGRYNPIIKAIVESIPAVRIARYPEKFGDPG